MSIHVNLSEGLTLAQVTSLRYLRYGIFNQGYWTEVPFSMIHKYLQHFLHLTSTIASHQPEMQKLIRSDKFTEVFCVCDNKNDY